MSESIRPSASHPVRPTLPFRAGLFAATVSLAAVVAPGDLAASGPIWEGEPIEVGPGPSLPFAGPEGFAGAEGFAAPSEFAGPQGFVGPVPFAGPRPRTPDVPPPPGTLGRTYLQPSCPVPETEHPRTAMLHVRCAAGAMVCVSGMKGELGTDGTWRFRSEKPLIPGVPHLVTVQVTRAGADPRAAAEILTVRLIMGRVVGLTV